MVHHPDSEHSSVVPELYNFPEWRENSFYLPNFAKVPTVTHENPHLGSLTALAAPAELCSILVLANECKEGCKACIVGLISGPSVGESCHDWLRSMLVLVGTSINLLLQRSIRAAS